MPQHYLAANGTTTAQWCAFEGIAPVQHDVEPDPGSGSAVGLQQVNNYQLRALTNLITGLFTTLFPKGESHSV